MVNVERRTAGKTRAELTFIRSAAHMGKILSEGGRTVKAGDPSGHMTFILGSRRDADPLVPPTDDRMTKTG